MRRVAAGDRRHYRKLGYGMFTVEARGTGAVVGFCGLVHPGGQPDVEVKYAFLRSYWGQGLATEHVIATVAPDNTASHRVLAKARMTQRSPRHNPDGSITHVSSGVRRIQLDAGGATAQA